MSFKAARKLFRDLIRIPKNFKQHVFQDNESKQVVLNSDRSYGVLEVASAQIRPNNSSIAKTTVVQSKRLQNAYCYIRTISRLFGVGNAAKVRGFTGKFWVVLVNIRIPPPLIRKRKSRRGMQISCK